MGKFKQAVGLVLSALMMVGAAVGIKPMAERASAEDTTATWTATSGGLGSGIGTGTITDDKNNSWNYTRTLKSGSSYTGWSSNCIQLGKSGGVENLTISTSNIVGTIKSVSFECSSYNNAHNVSISVGGTSYLASTATAKWTTVSTLTGEGSSSGEIVINVTDGTRAFYVKSLSVTYANSSTAKTITYELGSDDATNTGNPNSYEPGTEVELLNPSRPGYTFLYWTLGADGPQIESIPSTQTGDITLVAHWSKKVISDISLNFQNLDLFIGEQEQLTATISPDDVIDASVTWSVTCNPSGVLTVSNNGLIEACAVGTATVKAKSSDSDAYATCVVNVTAGDETHAYKKVESNLTDWSGTYLLCYETEVSICCFNGADEVLGKVELEKKEGSDNLIPVSRIANTNSVIIESMTGGYSVKINDSNANGNAGKYISGTSGENTINFTDSPVACAIEEVGTGVFKLTSNTSIFSYNSSSDQQRFRFYKSTSSQKNISFYKYTNLEKPKLDSPAFTLENNVVTVSEVSNASSYVVGLFESDSATSPILSFEVVDGKVTLKDLPQGVEYYIRAKAFGDGENYLDSDYTVNSSTFVWNQYSTKTIAEALSLDKDTGDNHVYYEFTGTIVDVDSTYSNNFYLTDNKGNSIYVYRLLKELGGEDANLNELNLQAGDSITIRAYRSEYSGKAQLRGFYVSSEVNEASRKGTEFASNDTHAQLSFAYQTTPDVVFSKFTDDIEEGDYVISSNGTDFATALIASNRIQKSSTIIESNDILKHATNKTTVLDSADIWHFELNETIENVDYYTIYNASTEKYLASTGADNKAALNNGEITDKEKWKIVRENDKFEIINKYNSGVKTNSNLRCNGSYGFACYSSSTGSSLTLYKGALTNTYSVSDMNLTFGAFVPASLYNSIAGLEKTVEYGVGYKFEGQDSYKNVAMKNGGAFVANGRDTNKLDERIEEAVANGHYFQFSLTLTGIPKDDYNVKVTAAAYVKIGSDYFYMNEVTYSVATLAKDYLTNEGTKDTDAVKNNKGVLQYLASFDVPAQA